MPIKTIEEVITRIIAINRELDEEALNSLLVASGWEKLDIDNGLKVFRRANQHTTAISPYVEDLPVVYEINDHSLAKIIEDKKINTPDNNQIVNVSESNKEILDNKNISANQNNWIMVASNLLLVTLLVLLALYLFKLR